MKVLQKKSAAVWLRRVIRMFLRDFPVWLVGVAPDRRDSRMLTVVWSEQLCCTQDEATLLS